MEEVTVTMTRVAVSTLPKVDVNPAVRRVVERALGRYMKTAIGIEQQRLLGLHDMEMTSSDRQLLWRTALDVETKAAIREMLAAGDVH